MSRGRRSTGSSSEDTDKRLRGFQHIISELSGENAELKEKYESVREEVELLKEENKLLEETKDLADGSGGDSSKELLAAQAIIKVHERTISELNREMAELESLIESKIYREDELESRLANVEKELERYRPSRQHQNGSPIPSHGHSRTTSIANSIKSGSSVLSGGSGEERCELCEGPHDLDACPVFAGNMMGEELGGKVNGGMGMKKAAGGRFCADCEVSRCFFNFRLSNDRFHSLSCVADVNHRAPITILLIVRSPKRSFDLQIHTRPLYILHCMHWLILVDYFLMSNAIDTYRRTG